MPRKTDYMSIIAKFRKKKVQTEPPEAEEDRDNHEI